MKVPALFFPWRLDLGRFELVSLIQSQVHLLLHQVEESQDFLLWLWQWQFAAFVHLTEVLLVHQPT